MIIKYTCVGCKKEFEAQDWRKRKYCSKKCKGLHDKSGQYKKGHKHNEATEQKRIARIKANHKGMLGKKHSEKAKKQMSESSKKPYNYIDGGYRGKIKTNKCSMCGESEKRILIHHKDENRTNNELSNLQAVCDSCHRYIHYKLNGKVNKIDWKNKNEIKKYQRNYHKNKR